MTKEAFGKIADGLQDAMAGRFSVKSPHPHCEWCEGQEHHWVMDADEEHDEPFMACKHCDATRPATDADFDDLE